MSAYTPAQLADKFVRFADECQPGSPLYAYLSPRIAADADLIDLARATRPGQPPPNMLFGAAHYLLLGDRRHPLAGYYATLGGAEPPGESAFAAFRDFCLGHAGVIRPLLAARITQTNETRRCAYLLPAFQTVAAQSGRPLALLEIGPSAGLNMLWDRYRYDYGELQAGDPAAPVCIASELRGPARPPIPARMPAVAWRCGVEISPPDLGDADAVRWLEALIWPEKTERMDRLRAAIAMARSAPPPIIAGDALALLPAMIAAAPADAALCVYHTHVTYQLSHEGRARLGAILAEAGRGRTIYRLGCEGSSLGDARLTLTVYAGEVLEERPLATASGHGDWVEWVAAGGESREG
ncbi:DUF2332 domain-containing protein [Oscillochloris sp. ZM17-4]|uniref:DUF2332 domain-containing protein n=1 Tax=Oscillochloris sp. ZM17-4 TaxID=2866714 RepID=UPI001C72DB68|nr:DUF2332 domain-containing protein [Oscillochloris sp. ZM17-4]